MARSALLVGIDAGSRADMKNIESLLTAQGVGAAEVVALTDEGTLALVAAWPGEPGSEPEGRWVWSEGTWAAYLEGLAISGMSHRITDAGRAFYPLSDEGLLWGALVVDPGAACPDALAQTLAPYWSTLVDAVRAHV